MFSFKKKNESKLRWHPDFRVVDQLPDTKIVRTRFLVNSFGVAIFVILLVFVGLRELTKFGIVESISSAEQEILEKSSTNRNLEKMNREFRSLSTKLQDIKSFNKQPIRPNELLVELTRIRTLDVVFNSINYENNWDSERKKEVHELELLGMGRTTADIGELKNRLSIMELPDKYFLEVSEEGNPTKDPMTGVFSFAIRLTIMEEANGSK